MRVCYTISFLTLVLISAMGADFVCKQADTTPPDQASEVIRKVLGGKTIQLVKGDKPVYEFWFVKDLTLATKPESDAKALAALKEGMLLGLVQVHGSLRDYRDDELAEGVYTARFGLQPTDGNHLGTAEFPYFMLLSPVKVDQSPETLPTYKRLVRFSSEGTTSDHPRILSLRPISVPSSDLPKLATPIAEHKTVAISIPVTAGGGKAALPFEIVYEGVGKK